MQQRLVRRASETLQYFGVVIELKKIGLIERADIISRGGDTQSQWLSRQQYTEITA